MLRRLATAALAAAVAVVAEEIAHGQQKLRNQVVVIVSPEVLAEGAAAARIARVAATVAAKASGGLGIAIAANDPGSRAYDSESIRASLRKAWCFTYSVLSIVRHAH